MNQKSEKTLSRYTYLDGFGKFYGDFCLKIFFYPCSLLNKFGAKKSLVGDFSKI